MTAFLRQDLREWTKNIRGDILGGCVSAFSVIPEVIGFTIVAGVNPVLGLCTSIAFLVLMSFLGGCPAMVSAGAGSMAVVVVSLVRDYDLSYLFAAVLLAGVIQIILGFFRIGNLIRFVPAPVVAGFCDALAIIIFKSQVMNCIQYMGRTRGSICMMFLLIAVGLLVIWLFPCVTRAVPSTLIAIVVVTLVGMIKNRSRWLAQRSIVTVATVVVVVVTNNFACGAAVGIALYYLVWLIRRRRKVSGEGRGAKANVGRESALWKS